MKACMRCLIRGCVQGVCFRAGTRHKAEQLDLVGYARNLPDGRVEVMACGEEQALEVLKAWLHKGPELAEVAEVVSERLPGQEFTGFSIS